MSAIRKLERSIADLTLAGPPFADRNSDLLGQTIAKRILDAKQIRTTRSVITITI